MAASTLHVAFGPASGAALRKALRLAGREEPVAAMVDDLSFGPIDPPDPAVRTRWIMDELGYRGDLDDIAPGMAAFWADVLGHRGRLVAWLSRRSAAEYCGFLEFLWRIGWMSCDVADLTDATLTIRGPDDHVHVEHAVTLGSITPGGILKADLLALPTLLAAATRNDGHRLWRALRAENAPLRTPAGGTLRSAPLTVFDELLMSYAVTTWRKAARVIGEAMMSFVRDELDPTNDLVLSARLRALADAGRLEFQGDLTQPCYSEVRLPQGVGN